MEEGIRESVSRHRFSVIFLISVNGIAAREQFHMPEEKGEFQICHLKSLFWIYYTATCPGLLDFGPQKWPIKICLSFPTVDDGARLLMLHSPKVKSAILAGVVDYAIEETGEAYVKIGSSYSPSPFGRLAIRRCRSVQRQASTARCDRRGSSARSYSEHPAPRARRPPTAARSASPSHSDLWA